MCFSASASFVAASTLSIIGLLSVYTVRAKPRYFMIAAVPLLFALQQLCEGIIWISPVHSLARAIVQYVFLFIAAALWPWWIPTSLWLCERRRPQKKLLLIIALLGIVWLLGISVLLIMYGMQTMVQEHIAYQIMLPFMTHDATMVPYALLITLPCFISSLRGARWFGLGVIAAGVVSYLYWYQFYGSVWCFFAALLSCMVYWMVKKAVQ